MTIYFYEYENPVIHDLTDAELRYHLENLCLPEPSSLKPLNKDLAAFGKELFFDASLSANGSISCASCHIPDFKFTDKKPLSIGIGTTSRNAPTLVNTVLNHWFFWDGRADSLESQASGPLEHPLEHGASRTKIASIVYKKYRKTYEHLFGRLNEAALSNLPADALAKSPTLELSARMSAYALTTITNYGKLGTVMSEASKSQQSPAKQFSAIAMQDTDFDPAWYAAWDTMSAEQKSAVDQTYHNILKAIAAYEQSLYSLPSSFDDFATSVLRDPTGDPKAHLTAAFDERAFLGFTIFLGKGQCILCHDGPNFTDNQFHNTGLKQLPDTPFDIGRARGVLLAMKSPLNCLVLGEGDTESCRELPYLDVENLELMGAFKTPTLRHVAETGPYMHDGRMSSLDEVLTFYSTLPDTPAIGHREESLKTFALNAEERHALLTFLRSLSSQVIER